MWLGPRGFKPFVACLAISSLLLSLFCLTACDRSDPADKIPRVPIASITGPGVVRGRVLFNGPTPPEKLVRNEPCCPGAPPTQRDETVTVNANGTLADAVVYIEDGPRTDGTGLPHQMLDQIFCRYVPHVVGVVVGQTLDIHSSDPTVHNVQIRPAYAPAQNFWMPNNQTSPTSFRHAEFIHSTCDVHTWMSATIAVFDNAFFSITNSNGTFSLSGIPKGTYKLVAWHELYGKIEKNLIITDDKPIEIDFTYQPPKS